MCPSSSAGVLENLLLHRLLQSAQCSAKCSRRNTAGGCRCSLVFIHLPCGRQGAGSWLSSESTGPGGGGCLQGRPGVCGALGNLGGSYTTSARLRFVAATCGISARVNIYGREAKESVVTMANKDCFFKWLLKQTDQVRVWQKSFLPVVFYCSFLHCSLQ